MVGCKIKIGANAIRLHDEVVCILAKLFRSLRVDAIVEPLRIFSDASPASANQRPDILLRNPRGFGRQVILDVAVTAVDGQYSICPTCPPITSFHDTLSAVDMLDNDI